MKTVSYDPQIIQEFASRLYRQAASAIFVSTLLGIVIGLITGGFIATSAKDQTLAMVSLGIGFFVGAVVGYIRGKERAFKLRLEAQIALCQVQIEKHVSP